jgi:hypothetical protein
LTASANRSADRVFPADLAARYEAQDEQLRTDRVALVDELELITEADGSLGWYLTGKLPVIDRRPNPSQLERRMQKVFGLAPKQYVVKARVDEACRLLTHTNDPLATIAAACGWYDQSAFTRQFTRVTGCPPGEFRSRNHG